MGADIGGTFTDIVLEVGEQRFSTKLLTTYEAPERAIIEGMQQVCSKAGIEPSQITQIIHGTTLATNALIERDGAKTALITTQGFRDVIEMRTESRFEQYDLNLELPPPLLPRQQRYTLKERVTATGDIAIAISDEDINALVEQLIEANYESIAIGFLHSYIRPEHERRVRDILLDRMPDAMVSLSSEVSPQMREYERFNTTVANAYIKPLMKSYLSRLQAGLSTKGFNGDVFLIHSGGGIISVESAAEFPVRLVESGPAGGAVFAASIAREHKMDKVLSFDMGGTTAKICLIDNYSPNTSRVFEVARSYRFKKGSGMPISIPVIDMVEIGAGGGSLAKVDSMGQIRVGPESAGSEPGPACYGRGGQRPAVTDADLILGKLDADNFAGGTMKLEKENSIEALRNHIGKSLNLDEVQSAHGLAEVVDENMANAARAHAVENGKDLSEYSMIAFGGAAPLHAGRLCEKLGITELLIPQGAGVGSAIGFLRAPFAYEATRSSFMNLDQFDHVAASHLLEELREESESFVRTCDKKAAIDTQVKLYMRYTGQGWEIPVTLNHSQSKTLSTQLLKSRFEEEYKNLFGRGVQGMSIEITVWSVNTTTAANSVETQIHQRPESKSRAMSSGQRMLFDKASNQLREVSWYQREQISMDQELAGPAIIVEDETSIMVPSNSSATQSSDGSICIEFLDTTAELQKQQNRKEQTPGSDADIKNQVMWNRLISVVEEQALALIRTAFSTSVREAGDLSAGVYDYQGRMLAQAVTGTPGHVNAMAAAVSHFIDAIGYEEMFPGDVYVTNDPWLGTGHLHDITVVTPAFVGDKHIGFLACTSHVVDIGGRGFGAEANSVYEEGFYMPIMKLAERGQFDQTLLKLLRQNVREPDQVTGDLFALATCNEVGLVRLQEMMAEFAISDLKALAAFILESSRQATIDRIKALSNQSASGSMMIDGYSDPIRLETQIEIQDEKILCDFRGSSDIDIKGINVPLVYTQAYACYALKCAIAPEIPNNAASLAPFEISAPENSILNAIHPAPVALRHVIGHMIPDTVYNALDKILADTVPVEGAGTLCNFQLSLRPANNGEGNRREVLTFNSGGSGARPTLDGMNSTAFPSGVMTMPVEATEHAGPVIIWRKELRENSGGAGENRGGLGQYMDVGAQPGHEFDFSAMFDRVNYPALGRRGGQPGAPTVLERDTGESLAGKGKFYVPEGHHLKLQFPGGAGYGDPTKRCRSKVKLDLLRDYIDENVARELYQLSEQEIDQVQEMKRKGQEI